MYILVFTTNTHIPIWNVFSKIQSNIAICNTLKHNTELTCIVSPITDSSCIVFLIIPTYNYLVPTVAMVNSNFWSNSFPQLKFRKPSTSTKFISTLKKANYKVWLPLWPKCLFVILYALWNYDPLWVCCSLPSHPPYPWWPKIVKKLPPKTQPPSAISQIY